MDTSIEINRESSTTKFFSERKETIALKCPALANSRSIVAHQKLTKLGRDILLMHLDYI